MKTTTTTTITIPIDLLVDVNHYASENDLSFSKACSYLLNSALGQKPKKTEDIALKDMQTQATRLSMELTEITEQIKKQKNKREQKKLKRGVEGVDWLIPKNEAEALRFQAKQRRRKK